MPTNVFITGASGFIGRALAENLRADGAVVAGVDQVADEANGVVAGDITAPASWSAQLQRCDVVVHTAAVVSNAVDLDEQWRINVLGTRRVLEAARDAGVRRFVTLSSVRAFSDGGFPPNVTEDYPVRTDGNPYVDTKIASEHVVLAAHAAGEIEAVIVRPGDIYGPGSVPWVLKPLDLIRSGQLVLPARGAGLFSATYIDDLVAGLRLTVDHPAAAGQIFTIAGAQAVRSDVYFGHLFAMLGKSGPRTLPTSAAVAIARAADRVNRLRRARNEVNAASMRYLARPSGYSIEKARRLLGYEPQVDLDEGMRRTEVWLREEGLI